MEHLQQTADFFYEQLGEIYDADNQLVEALLHMRDRTMNTDLHQILMAFQKQKKEQCSRLKDIIKTLNTELLVRPCDEMKSLIQQALSISPDPQTAQENDLDLTTQLKNIQTYQISAYQAALRLAKMLNLENVPSVLEQLLNDEKSASQKLAKFGNV
jgi:ferritin-like metal-binding protein YciE